MTVAKGTDGMIHPEGGLHDHHAAPTYVEIDDTTTSIPPGSTANVDVSLPRSDYQIARVIVFGPKSGVYGGPSREGAYIQATTSASDGFGTAARDAGAGRQYGSTFSKNDGSTVLSDRIFDSNTSLYNRRIAIEDCYIMGSTLRFKMRNYFGGSATVWMKGAAVLQ